MLQSEIQLNCSMKCDGVFCDICYTMHFNCNAKCPVHCSAFQVLIQQKGGKAMQLLCRQCSWALKLLYTVCCISIAHPTIGWQCSCSADNGLGRQKCCKALITLPPCIVPFNFNFTDTDGDDDD